jgi:glycosyltransferase involved in cell wall biosynthesis
MLTGMPLPDDAHCMKKVVVTFVLPGNNWSGGVRVTVLMGNLLLERGHRIRIVHPKPRFHPWGNLSSFLSQPKRILVGRQAKGWLETFAGKIEQYRDINELEFEQHEIVIGVGTYMVPQLQNLRAGHVTKVRYNHGFPARMTDEYRAAWSLSMPTITVSKTLVPQLERLSAEKVRAVIPNGIDIAQYHPVAGVKRDAIGTIFSLHPNKAPQDIIRLVNRVAEVLPDTPRLVFSTERRPRELVECCYEQCPPIDRVRETYSRSLIWLLASHTEGLPGPVLEAMACGAVVISTDNDGSVEVIQDGVNGLIVPKSDFDAFMEKIRLVLSDDTLRKRLAQGGFETVKKYTWANAADRMEEFLDEISRETEMKTRQNSRVSASGQSE